MGIDDINQNYNIVVITAYTEDYSIGYLCENINQDYANKHGYQVQYQEYIITSF